ncbi:PAS domain-containing sensor histidine kinase [Pleomorphomonas oryzae]|uniref:PAS domain-containing sensor histidine kinase n=1 Tax=Pleomorphomonas oryzae TaxID=261934 RepID=UPI00042966DA|nr:PAS domain-containing sensor histidine kinase [Pleomorphomonas oryzae]
MSGGADLFRVLSQTENVGALIADTRPSLVVDRTGCRLLWANAAGAAFFGIATVEKLTALRFSAASPFARRITALDDTLASGQDRIERLPLQRGLLPRPTVCKASRVTADGIKAILLTIVDGTGSFVGDPTAAFATLAATAVPETTPEPDPEPVENIAAVPAVVPTDADDLADTDMVEPAEAASEEMAFAPAAENDESVADATVPEVIDAASEEIPFNAAEPSPEEASPEPAADAAITVHEDLTESVKAIEEEPAALLEVLPEERLSEPVETTTVAETAVPSEPNEPAETPIEVIPSEVAEHDEATAEEASPEPVEAPAAPTFTFPAHGRAVRFVFELDPQLAFTFVSSDLAATVGPGMADILGRSWTEVAGRLEFDPGGRIAEALGRRDTFTGLTVDWPVEGENLRVPADLAGMPVFGRERSFRGYRGFGVLKTGAAFEAPVPAEPIILSEPDGAAPLPIVDEMQPADGTDMSAEPAVLPVVDDIAPEQAPAAALESFGDLSPTIDETVSEEPIAPITEVVTEPENTAPEAVEELDQVEADNVAEDGNSGESDLSDAEVDTASEHLDPSAADGEVASEEEAPGEPDEPTEVVLEATPSESIVSAEELAPEAAEPVTDEPVEAVPESQDSTPADNAGGEPVVAEEPSAETDELQEPLPLITPPPEEEAVDVADPEPAVPSVPEVVSSPVEPHRTFASLTGDKARALSKPERDAFDKIAEALADAFGPRILSDSASRAIVPQGPVVERKAEVPADTGPTVDIALLDKLPIALAILRGGDIIHANKAFLDLCGYPDVAAIDADGGFAQVFEGAALNRDAAIPAIRRRDGVEIPVSARLHSMPMEGGIASLLVVQETVATTSRDRLATAEQRTEDMEAILDTATDGVLVLDQKGLVIGANRSAEALFGNERSHMIGMAFVDLLAPESHRSALDYLDGLSRNALSSVLNDGREVIGRVAGGGLVPLFMTIGRVSATKFCAVLRDITQWKRAEEELTSAKKAAENASSQKSDFLAKMSHEIRTPLNAIIGFSEVMMEERFGPVGNDRYKEYLRDIHVSGTHIMSLVNDLLDLSKIEAGKLELTFEAVGLNDVVRECAALMQPQANRERIIIRTSLSSSLPPVVADNRSLRQIILNLLSNAVKFNSAGGQVIVSTLYEESGEVVLRVRDTGQGMSEGDIVKAMEPFRQLSTSRTGGGTGLGLPLTKALVEANRAAFQIDSTPGQGTMIQITFPSTRVLAE